VSVDHPIWSQPGLMNKARLYSQRAEQVEATSSLFAIWSLMAFEFVARAAVADVHPALLADPQNGEYLLYGFGYGSPEPPRSVPLRTVLRRCLAVIPSFTDEELKKGIFLSELRNAELHTADASLEELPTSAWTPSYYELLEILLDAQSLAFEDLFGQEQADSAREIITAGAEDVESSVKQEIADRRRDFDELEPEEREARRARGVPEVIKQVSQHLATPCPACGTRGWLSGKVLAWSDPRVGDDQIERDASVLPTSFACPACGLELKRHGELIHAGLGDQYSITEAEDPLEYYGIDPHDYVDPADFFEEDYGNE
jgi:hypothetical protein